jgi:hypothetical protein
VSEVLSRVVPSSQEFRAGAPSGVHYSLGEALTLLAALEDARDALIDSGHLAVVVVVEAEVRLLSRRLGFWNPSGGDGG